VDKIFSKKSQRDMKSLVEIRADGRPILKLILRK
jgi:hypothetical protein